MTRWAGRRRCTSAGRTGVGVGPGAGVTAGGGTGFEGVGFGLGLPGVAVGVGVGVGVGSFALSCQRSASSMREPLSRLSPSAGPAGRPESGKSAVTR